MGYRTPDRSKRPYGWRARIGLIVPSPNTVTETEFWRMAPEGVSIHTTRLLYRADEVDDPVADMEQFLPQTLEELRAQVLGAPVVRCDEVAWSLFGISMAGYNGLISLATGLAAMAQLRRRGERRMREFQEEWEERFQHMTEKATLSMEEMAEKIKEKIENENLTMEILELDVDNDQSVNTAVKTILEKKQEYEGQKNHCFFWNGQDGDGLAQPSGIYFFSIYSDLINYSVKVVYLK